MRCREEMAYRFGKFALNLERRAHLIQSWRRLNEGLDAARLSSTLKRLPLQNCEAPFGLREALAEIVILGRAEN